MVVNNKVKDRRLERRDHKSRIGLRVDEDEIPSLLLSDPNGNGGFTTYLRPDGRPHIRLKAPVGQGTIDIGFLLDGNPVMSFKDKDGKASDEIPSLGEPEQRP
jgi:hypothetical protein